MLDQEQIKDSFRTIKKYEDWMFHKAWMQGIFIIGFFSLLYSIILIPYTLEMQNVSIYETFPFPEFLGIYLGFYKFLFILLTFIGLIIVFLLFKTVKRTEIINGVILDKRDFSLLIAFFAFWFFTSIYSYIYRYFMNNFIVFPLFNGSFDDSLIIKDIIYYYLYCENNLSIIIFVLSLSFLLAFLLFKPHKFNLSFSELFPIGILLLDLSVILGTLKNTIYLSGGVEYFEATDYWIINPTMFYIGLSLLIAYLLCYITKRHQNKIILLYSGIILFPLSFLTGRFTILLFYDLFKFDLDSLLSFQSMLGLSYSFITSIFLISYAFYLRRRNNLLQQEY